MSEKRRSLMRRANNVLDVDGRGQLPRLYRELCRSISNELGGEDQLSTVQIGLIRRYAGLSVLAEDWESQMLQGKNVDLTEMMRITNVLTRLARQIGLSRKAQSVPSIKDYLAGKGRKRARVSDYDDED